MNYKKELLEGASLEDYLVSEKLDGVRAIWTGENLLTRQGNKFAVPQCWIEHFPPFTLDGELFIARGTFEEVLRIVSQKQGKCEEWQKITYYVFDVPMCCESQKAATLKERLAQIEQFLDSTHNNVPIKVIAQKEVDSERSLYTMLKEVVKNGGEGLVIRKNNAPYEYGRTKNALKLKLYDDTECKVIAHNAGKGRLKGKMGSLLCEQIVEDGKILRFKIGSGFSDQMRENPPPLGSIITYKHYGYTKNGIPKFASFLRLYHQE